MEKIDKRDGKVSAICQSYEATPKTKMMEKCLQISHLEFRKPLDGFERPQNSQNSEGLYCLDVSAFVVSVDSEIKYLGT